MPTYLYIHPLPADTEQHRFRSSYELRNMDYELSRSVNSKGEIVSGVTGGQIRVVINGFGDDDLFRWLFGSGTEESGEIITMDEGKRTTSQLLFSRAVASGYQLHFDANIKDGVTAALTIEAGVMTTDNELHYENR